MTKKNIITISNVALNQFQKILKETNTKNIFLLLKVVGVMDSVTN